MLFLPILSILIYFFSYGGAQSSTEALKVGVVNQDQGKYTVQLVQSLHDDHTQEFTHLKEARQALKDDQVAALILLEKGSNHSFITGTPKHFKIASKQGELVTEAVKTRLSSAIKQVDTLVKASDQQSFSKYAASFNQSKLSIEQKNIDNHADLMKAMSAQIIGFLCMMLLYAAGNLGELILKEKENRTFYRLMTTPITAIKYILGNALFTFCMLLFEICICLLAMKFVFNIDPGMSYLALFFVLIVFILMAVLLSLALGFSATSRKSVAAIQVILFTVSSLLSGALIPIFVMPTFMQKIAHFMPQYWVMEAISDLQKNGSLLDISMSFLVLCGYALLFFSIAAYKYKRNNQLQSFV